MSAITRRRFAAALGLVTFDGALRRVCGQAHTEDHKPAAVTTKPTPPVSKPTAGTKPAPASVAAPVDRAYAAPEQIWAELMQGNKRFVAGKTAQRDVIRARAETARAQHPFVIVLCCSDSWVSPELIFDQNIGDLFVVRTAGNVADQIALGSMEYAVEHLGSRVLLVLGHEKCGAVAATLSGEAMPSENLEALVKKIRPGIDHLKNLVTGETLNSLAVEANVHHSAADSIENSPIIRHAVASGDLAVFKAVYKVNTGEVFAISRFQEPKPRSL